MGQLPPHTVMGFLPFTDVAQADALQAQTAGVDHKALSAAPRGTTGARSIRSGKEQIRLGMGNQTEKGGLGNPP